MIQIELENYMSNLKPLRFEVDLTPVNGTKQETKYMNLKNLVMVLGAAATIGIGVYNLERQEDYNVRQHYQK